MIYCVSVLANTLTIVNLDRKKWLTGLERKEIAAHAALNMYKTLQSDTFFTLLTTEHDDVIAFFKLEHMKDGKIEISERPDYQGYEYSQIIQRVALSITKTLLSLTNTVTSFTLQFLAVKIKK